ncbi:MAG: hypothetical protein Q8O38_16600 [Sulfurimicrobium sp.]|nr:hypothetical protein [Sulfurimicrobium sp.]
MTAETVAVARRLSNEATAAHQAAVDKEQAVRGRIAESQKRQAEITGKRLDGTATEADTAEFAALAGDVAALQAMLIAAEQSTVAADPREAQDALRAAENMHQREQDELAFNLLTEQAAKLEDALLRCVTDLHGIGRKLGRVSLVMSWRPTQRLARAVSQGVL